MEISKQLEPRERFRVLCDCGRTNDVDLIPGIKLPYKCNACKASFMLHELVSVWKSKEESSFGEEPKDNAPFSKEPPNEPEKPKKFSAIRIEAIGEGKDPLKQNLGYFTEGDFIIGRASGEEFVLENGKTITKISIPTKDNRISRKNIWFKVFRDQNGTLTATIQKYIRSDGGILPLKCNGMEMHTEDVFFIDEASRVEIQSVNLIFIFLQ